jgi:Golgi nucleoside diphosphatase
LIGSTAYIKRLVTVARESYPITLRQNRPIIVSGIAGNRTLTYLR